MGRRFDLVSIFRGVHANQTTTCLEQRTVGLVSIERRGLLKDTLEIADCDAGLRYASQVRRQRDHTWIVLRGQYD